jgi:hypothetical protein
VVAVTISSGAVASRFSTAGQMTLPVGLARDIAANYYVSSGASGVVWKYDGAGTPGGSAFATISGSGALREAAGYLFVCRPLAATVVRLNLANAAANTFLAPSQGVASPAAILFDATDFSGQRAFVVDALTGQVWLADGSGFVTAFGAPVSGGRSLAQREDGMLVVGGSDGPHLLTP